MILNDSESVCALAEKMEIPLPSPSGQTAQEIVASIHGHQWEEGRRGRILLFIGLKDGELEVLAATSPSGAHSVEENILRNERIKKILAQLRSLSRTEREIVLGELTGEDPYRLRQKLGLSNREYRRRWRQACQRLQRSITSHPH